MKKLAIFIMHAIIYKEVFRIKRHHASLNYYRELFIRFANLEKPLIGYKLCPISCLKLLEQKRAYLVFANHFMPIELIFLFSEKQL